MGNELHATLAFKCFELLCILFLLGGEDCYLRLWNIKSGQLLWEDKFCNSSLTNICWEMAESTQSELLILIYYFSCFPMLFHGTQHSTMLQVVWQCKVGGKAAVRILVVRHGSGRMKDYSACVFHDLQKILCSSRGNSSKFARTDCRERLVVA